MIGEVELDQRASLMGAASRIGVRCYFLACIALGSVELVFGKPLPELHPFPSAAPVAAYAAGSILALLGLGTIARVGGARRALALYWSLAVALTAFAAMRMPADPLNWVPVSKVALFAVAAAVTTGWLEGRVLRLSLGLALIFYGFVHLILHDVVAGLIPDWLQQPWVWPYLTGSLMLAAGLGLVAGRLVVEMALMIAGLFASWIPIIHLGRLAAHPGSSFEWTFALSAVAMTGIALMVAGDDSPGSQPLEPVLPIWAPPPG